MISRLCCRDFVLPRPLLPLLVTLLAVFLTSHAPADAADAPAAPSAPALVDPAFSDPASLSKILSLAPADATMLAIADARRVMETTLVQALLKEPGAAPALRFLGGLRGGAGFDLTADLQTAAFVASSDQTASAALILLGNFSPVRFGTYLQQRYRATALPEISPSAYRLPFGKAELFIAFPSPKIAILTLGLTQLQSLCNVTSKQAPALSSSAEPSWIAPILQTPRSYPVFFAFKDFGAFVGGQQPFAQVRQFQGIALEQEQALRAAFLTVLPTPEDANQFSQIINALRQLAAGYLKNVPRPLTSAFLESIALAASGKYASAQAQSTVPDALAIFRENAGGEQP